MQAHCKSATIADKNMNNVIIRCDSSQGGELVRSALQSAYPSYKFHQSEVGNSLTSSETVWSWLTLGGYNIISGLTNNWKNFSVATGNAYNAKKLKQEIDSCVFAAQFYVDEPTYDPYGTDSGGVEVGGGNSASTTYIIIGVAAAAILLLLLLWKE